MLFVIADHLFGWPHGGFVGVDIFFVISGFLITGLLIREFELTGKISFSNFYKRRVKRILPASALVLAVTVGASFLLLNATRAWSVFWDGVWATLFVANWRFASSGTDYFQADGPVSPLQHFWSLAVEEQYYFVWPWVMLAVLAIVARKSSKHARLAAGIAIALISAASFAWALLETQTSPTVAYFSTITRTWELGFGALLAIASPLLLRIPHVLRPILAWGGILIMLWSLFFVTEGPAFPAPAAAIPVLGVSLVLLAGVGGDQRFLAPLTNRVSGYIGNISYSLYLWHFPVIVLILPLLPFGPVWNEVASLLIVGAVSIAAYHMWEDTVRRSPWLDGKRAWAGYKLPSWWKYAGVATMAAATAVLVAVAMSVTAPRTNSTDVVAQLQGTQDGPTYELPSDLGPEATNIQTAIAASVALSAWPETSPTIDETLATDPYLPGTAGCGLAGADLSACFIGNGSKQILLVGDSIAMKWPAALVDIAERADAKIQIAAMYGCPMVDVALAHTDPALQQGCIERREEVKQLVATTAPEYVIYANTAVLPNGIDGSTLSVEHWSTALSQMLSVVRGTEGTIVLGAPPADKDLEACYTPRSKPLDCTSFVSQSWLAVTAAEAEATVQAGATYAPTAQFFCNADGICPPIVGQVVVKRDLTHTTLAYAQKLQAAFSEILGGVIL